MEAHDQTNAPDNVSSLNNALLKELKAKGAILTSEVEAAFRAVLRHLFVPEVSLAEAYADHFIVTKVLNGQGVSSSSQPAIMAIMLEMLDLKPGHNVLEIGAGTGYNAALMAHIVGETGEVTTLDIDEDIVENAKAHLSTAGFDRVRVVRADGGYGYSEAAPYDRIILTVGASEITPAWWQQLNPDGRLVLPLDIQGVRQVVAFERVNSHLASVSVKRGAFMMLRGDFAEQPRNFVPLASQPNLLIEQKQSQTIDGEAIYQWLTTPSQDWDTGVVVLPTEFGYMGGFSLWMTVHLPDLISIVATGELVERNIVPPLFGDSGENRYVATAIQLGDHGMAALMRPPDQPLPWNDGSDPSATNQPIPLYVRQFGADESISQRLIAVIKGWEEAGRPTTEQLHIRVYPKVDGYRPVEDGFVIETQLNRYIVLW